MRPFVPHHRHPKPGQWERRRCRSQRQQLAAETATYEALNRNTSNDMMNLGDILDEASRKE